MMMVAQPEVAPFESPGLIKEGTLTLKHQTSRLGYTAVFGRGVSPANLGRPQAQSLSLYESLYTLWNLIVLSYRPSQTSVCCAVCSQPGDPGARSKEAKLIRLFGVNSTHHLVT
jgi:hypothetical protein